MYNINQSNNSKSNFAEHFESSMDKIIYFADGRRMNGHHSVVAFFILTAFAEKHTFKFTMPTDDYNDAWIKHLMMYTQC